MFVSLLSLLFSAAPAGFFEAQIAAAIRDVERVYPVPAALIEAVIQQESRFNPRALSKVGAIGLMQVMPYNATRVGLTAGDLWDPAKNVLAGTRLLAVLLRYYRGDLISALVAYNARPREIFAPIPRNGETPKYVAAVLRFFYKYSIDPPRNSRPQGRSAADYKAKPDWLLIGRP